MKDYLCISCGEDFNDPLTIGENNSEAVVCPVCKSDQFKPNIEEPGILPDFLNKETMEYLFKRYGHLQYFMGPFGPFVYDTKTGETTPEQLFKIKVKEDQRGPGNYGC